MAFKQINEVRGVFYNPKQGLYLIKTPRSAAIGQWTTAGGVLPREENHFECLIRIVARETGMIPLEIAEQPFISRYFLVSEESKTVNINAYMIELPFDMKSSPREGRTTSGLPYKVFSNEELRELSESQFTSTTNKIIHSRSILGS